MCRVFEYEVNDGSLLYLNGPDSANPEKLLSLYVDWYNKDFAPFEKTESVSIENYKYVRNFCPLDFYDDYYSTFGNRINLTLPIISENFKCL